MDKIPEKLENINETLREILKVLNKPEDKFNRTLERIVLIIGVFGIITIIDTIREWIMGG